MLPNTHFQKNWIVNHQAPYCSLVKLYFVLFYFLNAKFCPLNGPNIKNITDLTDLKVWV